MLDIISNTVVNYLTISDVILTTTPLSKRLFTHSIARVKVIRKLLLAVVLVLNHRLL